VIHDAEYEGFIGETGIDFERDLDEVAVAVHSIGNNEHRYSEIFNARFDSQKLSDYLRKHARMWCVTVAKRSLRSAGEPHRAGGDVDLDSVAVSNLDDPV